MKHHCYKIRIQKGRLIKKVISVIAMLSLLFIKRCHLSAATNLLINYNDFLPPVSGVNCNQSPERLTKNRSKQTKQAKCKEFYFER